MSVTLTQIAKHCGRSLSTVSNVLRNGERARRYSDSTRQEVLEAATALGYRPNFFASQLQRQNRRLIMLTYSSIRDSFAAGIAHSFSQVITKRSFATLTAPLDQSRQSGLLDEALGAQGILALGVIGDASAEVLPDRELIALADRGVHIVCIGRAVDSERICQVLYDNAGGVQASIDHLVETGARRFWLIGDQPGHRRPTIFERRLDLARQRLAHHGLPEPMVPELRKGDWQPERARHAMQAALATRQPAPEAVFCTSDQYALGALQALRQHGLQPGRDVAVTGFNDDGVNAFLETPLTSVHIPVDHLGRLAANQLLDLYEGNLQPPAALHLEARLIVRESSQRIHQPTATSA